MSIRVGLRHMARSAVYRPAIYDAFRKSHEIDGSTGGAQEDYHVPIKVHYGEIVYFTENGIHSPNARSVYYNDKTYIVWQGDAGYDPYIICYDHATDTYSDAVKIGTNPLANDAHGDPLIIIDSTGYIHIFYGSHFTNLKYAKSDNPEDITAWTAQADPTANCTYPQAIADNGDIHLFYRDTPIALLGQRVYRFSNDNGATWGALQVIIERQNEGDGIYGRTEEQHGTKIHTCWRYYDLGVGHRHVYHAYLELSDGKMYSMNGTDLGVSISKAEADANCLIVNTGAFASGHLIMHLDGDGYPYIMYAIETGVGTNQDLRFIRWNGANWVASESITETDHSGNTMNFIIHSATSITCFLIGSGPAGRGGDVEKWTWNGSTWSEIKTILSEVDSGMPLCVPRAVFNNHEDLQFTFAQYGGVGVGDLKVYASDGDGLVPLQDEGENVYCHERCRTDFGDIRFRQGETELEHWLEEKVDSDYALFWVKVPTIPASGSAATIYVYYGKEDVTSASTESRENFTTYTEVEEVDDIQKTAYHVDFYDKRDRTTYLYKDYGANYFDDYAENLYLKRITHADGAIINVIVMADVIKGVQEMAAVNDPYIVVAVSGTLARLGLAERDAGGAAHTSTPDYVVLTLGTIYYLALRKYGTYIVLDTYSTAELRHAGENGDVGHQTLTLTVNYSHQYTYVGSSRDTGTLQVGTSDFESQFLRKNVEPEPTNGAWGSEEAVVWPF